MLHIGTNVWITWWSPTEDEQAHFNATADPRCRHARIVDGPVDLVRDDGTIGRVWMVITWDRRMGGWFKQHTLLPLNNEGEIHEEA